MAIRVRIAPSPTGFLHIGTARTALFNYLFAKKHGGSFILRIEDTDLERSDPEYENDIVEGLKWLGIEWDEGPIPGKNEYAGNYAPYRQSERIETYKKHFETLLKEGKIFYCFHSEKELGEEKNRLLETKRPPVHSCEYRTLGPEEARALAETKSDYIFRFKTPSGKKIIFNDLIRGEISFDSDILGDFSVAKKADIPLYNYAVVIDDFEMQITHVIRGEDHISNTPKQILLFEALGIPVPEYAHLPLILGPDRSKLSKRHGVTSINEFKDEGYLPEALFNFIALLGWSPGDDREILSKEELIGEFKLERTQRAGAVFDVQKLDWMNGHYIRQKPVPELAKLCVSFLEKAGLARVQDSKLEIKNYNANFMSDEEYLGRIVALEQPRLKKLSEFPEKTDYFFRNPVYEKELLVWKNMEDKEILESLVFSEEIVKSKIRDQKSKTEIETIFMKAIGEGNKGKILWPLRAALSGKKASPGPFEILEILGTEEALLRLVRARDLLRG